MRHTKTWTISLPPAMERQVSKLAKDEQRTKSELIRQALREYLVTHQLKELQKTLVPKARALGIRTEEDVNRVIHEFREEQRQRA